MVDGQLYDVERSTRFTSVQITPPVNYYVNYSGPVDSEIHYVTVEATWNSAKLNGSTTVHNYPLQRDIWVVSNGQLRPPQGILTARAILIEDKKNYDIYGNVRSVNQTYDCGLPLTEPYPLKMTERIAVTNQVSN